MEMQSRCASSWSLTGRSFTRVPLWLRRSRMKNPSASRTITQCSRDTELSGVEKWFCGSRPMPNRSPEIWYVVPCPGPPITVSLGLIPNLSSFTFWYAFCQRDSPSGTRFWPFATSESAAAAPNYVTFQCVAQNELGPCAFGVARAFIRAYPQDELEKQKRETRT